MEFVCVRRYQTMEDFADDARLIFDNCETFNEDDSAVGRAGHTMRRFFERRWRDILSARGGAESSWCALLRHSMHSVHLGRCFLQACLILWSSFIVHNENITSEREAGVQLLVFYPSLSSLCSSCGLIYDNDMLEGLSCGLDCLFMFSWSLSDGLIDSQCCFWSSLRSQNESFSPFSMFILITLLSASVYTIYLCVEYLCEMYYLCALRVNFCPLTCLSP